MIEIRIINWIMVENNPGSIPSNTLMMIITKDKRYDFEQP